MVNIVDNNIQLTLTAAENQFLRVYEILLNQNHAIILFSIGENFYGVS